MKISTWIFGLAASVAVNAHRHGSQDGHQDDNSPYEQRREAFEYVAEMCESDMETWCSAFLPDDEDDIDEKQTAYQLANCLSEQALSYSCSSAIAAKGLEPMVLCSGDVLNFCSLEDNEDKSSMIRCIRDNKSNFTTDCTSALDKGWVTTRADLNLPSTETASDYDVYVMLSVPDQNEAEDHHRMNWGIVAFVFVTFLVILGVSICACVKCCKCCKNHSHCRRSRTPPGPIATSQVVSAPYTGQGVTSTVQQSNLQAAVPISSAPSNQSIYYAAPAASAPPPQNSASSTSGPRIPYATPV